MRIKIDNLCNIVLACFKAHRECSVEGHLFKLKKIWLMMIAWMSFIIHKSLKVWKENTEVEAYHKKEIPNQSRENKHLSS